MEFENSQVAQLALENLQGKIINGQKIAVSFEKKKPPETITRGSSTITRPGTARTDRRDAIKPYIKKDMGSFN
jgi:RNA recognition motif-containing protein